MASGWCCLLQKISKSTQKKKKRLKTATLKLTTSKVGGNFFKYYTNGAEMNKAGNDWFMNGLLKTRMVPPKGEEFSLHSLSDPLIWRDITSNQKKLLFLNGGKEVWYNYNTLFYFSLLSLPNAFYILQHCKNMKIKKASIQIRSHTLYSWWCDL